MIIGKKKSPVWTFPIFVPGKFKINVKDFMNCEIMKICLQESQVITQPASVNLTSFLKEIFNEYLLLAGTSSCRVDHRLGETEKDF